jgi:hypothetical protein
LHRELGAGGNNNSAAAIHTTEDVARSLRTLRMNQTRIARAIGYHSIIPHFPDVGQSKKSGPFSMANCLSRFIAARYQAAVRTERKAAQRRQNLARGESPRTISAI